MTAAIPESRRPWCGCSAGLAAICWWMSGEALHSTQRRPSTETAIEDWLRLRACSVPARTPLQLPQLQFHCGKPPPAAEPSTRISTTAAGRLCGDRPGVTGAEPDQRLAMYELISIPKRNTTAVGVT